MRLEPPSVAPSGTTGRREGATQHHVIVPDEQGRWDADDALSRLSEATGIFIGGGDTAVYQRLYASEPVRSAIRERCDDGVPLAGLSAGAMLVPETCAIPAPDSGDSPARILPGIGLVKGLIIGVHFTQRDALPHILRAMAQTKTPRALGIDEQACVLLRNGELGEVVCGRSYEIKMVDFDSREYTIRNL